MRTVTIHEAKTHLSRLIAAVSEGEEIVLCRGRQPVARLTPLREPQRPRPRVGEVTSAPITVADDCFAALSDEELAGWGLL